MADEASKSQSLRISCRGAKRRKNARSSSSYHDRRRDIRERPPPRPAKPSRSASFHGPVHTSDEGVTPASLSKHVEKKPSQHQSRPRTRGPFVTPSHPSAMSEECREWMKKRRAPTTPVPDPQAAPILLPSLIDQFRKNFILSEAGASTESVSGTEQSDDSWSYEPSVRTDEMMRVVLPPETRQVMADLSFEQRRELCSRCALPRRPTEGSRGDNTAQNATGGNTFAPLSPILQFHPLRLRAERPLIAPRIPSPDDDELENPYAEHEGEIAGARHYPFRGASGRTPSSRLSVEMDRGERSACVCASMGGPCPVYGHHHAGPLARPARAAGPPNGYQRFTLAHFIGQPHPGRRICSSCRLQYQQQLQQPCESHLSAHEAVVVHTEETTCPRNSHHLSCPYRGDAMTSIQQRSSVGGRMPPPVPQHGMHNCDCRNCYSANRSNSSSTVCEYCRRSGRRR